MADFVISPIAKWALKKAATAAGGKAGSGILEFIYGDNAETKLDRVELKIRQLIDGQDRVMDLINALPANVTLHKVMIDFNTALRGHLLIVRSKSPTKNEVAALNAFLEFSGDRSALAIADNLYQCLFGRGCMTPQAAWAPTEDGALPAATFGKDSHVRASFSSYVQSKGNNLGLEEFSAKLFSIYEEILNYYAYLSFTVSEVIRFLESRNALNPDIAARLNPKLRKMSGLVEMLAERTFEYLTSIFPAGVELNHRLFETREKVRVAVLTKVGERIVECNNDKGRSSLKRGGPNLNQSQWDDLHYVDVNKIIYAEYNRSMLKRENPNLWWELSAPQASGVLPHTVALRTWRGDAYLGMYKFMYYSRTNKYGRGTSSEYEIGVGPGATHKVNWWSIYVSRDPKSEQYYFSFFNRYKNACLCVNEINQFKGRQSFVYGSPDGNDHKRFLLQFDRG